MTNTYLDEFRPPQHILLGPGPSSVNPRVLQAMTLPILGHLDPQFFQVMDEVCAMLREVYHTENPMTVPLSSTGTGAMEAACANILEAGDKMIVCRNGFFGDRLADIAERCGAQTVALDFPWGKSSGYSGPGRRVGAARQGKSGGGGTRGDFHRCADAATGNR